MLLNIFPTPHGVPKTLSSKNIMTGKPNLDYNNVKVEFRPYVQVFEDNNLTNTIKHCSTGAIALNPTGNTERYYHFMSLSTGWWLAQTVDCITNARCSNSIYQGKCRETASDKRWLSTF